MATDDSFDQGVVRIKVKKCDGMMQPEYKKLCVDPGLTSFGIIYDLLSRAFHINGDYTISYLSKDTSGRDEYVPLLSDMDLDLAFLNDSKPFLRLKVDLKPFEEGLRDLDEDDTGNEEQGLLGIMTSSLGKTISKAIWKKQSRILHKSPMSDQEFHSYLDPVGHLIKPQLFRASVYRGGVEESLRPVVWRHLLNVYPDGMSGKERFEYHRNMCNAYVKLRDQWKKMAASGVEYVKKIVNEIEKDVLRTQKFYEGEPDSEKNLSSLLNIVTTWALTHPSLSYVQGMTDMASLLLAVQKEEASAYLCFCGLMQRVQDNFKFLKEPSLLKAKVDHLFLLLLHLDYEFYQYLDGFQDVRAELGFLTRWFLLDLKREFPFNETLLVSEVLWSSLPPYPPDGAVELIEPGFTFKDNHAKARTENKPSIRQMYKQLMESTESGKRVSMLHYKGSSENDLSSLEITNDNETKLDVKGLSLNETGSNASREHDNPGKSFKFAKPKNLTDQSACLLTSSKSDGDISKKHTPVIDFENIKQKLPKLPPPNELGNGNPFLEFLCVSILLQYRDHIIRSRLELCDIIRIFDKVSNGHNTSRVLQQAQSLYATYLRNHQEESKVEQEITL